MPQIAIIAESAELLLEAQRLAQRLQLPLSNNICNNDYTAYLVVSGIGLKLQLANSRMNPISVEFTSGTMAHRCQYGGGKSQLIAKAIGIKNRARPRVLDLTAGLGRDAYVMAHLGCTVTMVERSPIIAALLDDGLKRALQLNDLATARLELIYQDSLQLLNKANLNEQFDVIYLDPMFTELDKSALVKKEMRILRELVGQDLDADKLLIAALQAGSKRVVVKRARLAPQLTNVKPSYQLIGKSTRFDIYQA